MSSRRKSRNVALMALYELEMNDTPIREVLKFKWYDKPIDQDDRDFAESIINGVVKTKESIDTLIKKYSKNWEFSRISIVNKCILRMSIYALLNSKEIPSSVTMDEALDLTREFESQESVPFINGILDAILKREILGDGRTTDQKE